MELHARCKPVFDERGPSGPTVVDPRASQNEVRCPVAVRTEYDIRVAVAVYIPGSPDLKREAGRMLCTGSGPDGRRGKA